MDQDWVLTAGHCVKDSANPAYYTVTVGEHNVNKKDPYEVNHAIKKVVKHPLYNGRRQTDTQTDRQTNRRQTVSGYFNHHFF